MPGSRLVVQYCINRVFRLLYLNNTVNKIFPPIILSYHQPPVVCGIVWPQRRPTMSKTSKKIKKEEGHKEVFCCVVPTERSV